MKAFATAQKAGLLAAGAGVLLCIVGVVGNPSQFFFSYLFAFVFWAGLTLGCLALLMIHHLTGGAWGFLIRRLLEAGVGAMPALTALFIPIFFGLGYLYSWARPGPYDAMLARKLAYLNLPAFALRAAVIFGLWNAMAFFLLRWSREQDGAADPAPTRRLRALSGPGVVLFAALGTVAAVDWVMVLENDWASTMFPVLMMVGQMLCALALCIALLARLRATPGLQQAATISEFHKLGNLLLAFVMLWAYLAVSQLIIIWSGNLPREISWYLRRVAGGWKNLAIFIGVFHFAAPFAILLWREAKRRPQTLGWIAAGVVAVHAAEVFWEIAPSLHRDGFALSWLDPVAFVTVGGFWCAAFCWRVKRAPLLSVNDPRQQPQPPEAVHV